MDQHQRDKLAETFRGHILTTIQDFEKQCREAGAVELLAEWKALATVAQHEKDPAVLFAMLQTLRECINGILVEEGQEPADVTFAVDIPDKGKVKFSSLSDFQKWVRDEGLR